MKKYISISLIALTIGISACKKEFDAPTTAYLPVGSVITLDSLRNMYQGTPIKFDSDISVYATVTMDETDGNNYKSVFVEDSTNAIEVRMPYGGGVYEGDYVRIGLRNVILSSFAGRMQLDSVSSDVNIIKQSAGSSFPPLATTIADINSQGVNLESRLVYLDNVQFLTEQTDRTYADSENKEDGELILSDCGGNQLIVSSSGYSNFADELAASGRGNITLIVSHNNGEVFTSIRSYAEINMSGERCDDGTYLALHRKDFEDLSITSDGWMTQVVAGGFDWEMSSFGNFVQISNFNGTNTASEAWMISPAYDLTNVASPVLQFDNAWKYNGDLLEVYVSTDFSDAGNVVNANWTKLTPTLSTGNFVWVNSGAIDLSAYKQSKVHIGFKYIGSDNDGSTWELDNIVIRDNP